MTFDKTLDTETKKQQEELQEIDSLRAALSGNVTLDSYVSFLEEAYHHVKHTVPILMAAGSSLRPDQSYLLAPIAEYIDEEKEHEEWILNDIAACGRDPELVRHGQPGEACEIFVSYIYDRIHRVNAACVFGMVHVLEGTSIQIATTAADRLRSSLGLPKEAFSYLYSHGSLDLEHYEFFRNLMGRVSDSKDREDILHTAQVAFHLYGNIFRTLPWQVQESAA